MLKVKKEIKTNYKVAVIANQLEKELNANINYFYSSKYLAWQRKLFDGDRYVYVTCESDGSITSIVLRIIMDVAKKFEDQYEDGRIISGVKMIEREKEGETVSKLAFYVLISKKFEA